MIPPFVEGDPVSASALESLRQAVMAIMTLEAAPPLRLAKGKTWRLSGDPTKPSVQFAVAHASGISARSGATPGSADCAFYLWDGTEFTTTGGRTQAVRNPFTVAVPAAAFMVVAYWSGSWWAIGWQCS